ncbi:MAG: nucleotidyltransferase family protein [Oscillospiraceae bacterium]|nr:nucleotidyltransferase family protein [Oscillospiraceae bacterium]
MKISGIICEYNPLHNGHIHHIEETRKNGATHIVGIMSGNYVQRGDVAILNKFDRAKLAVKSGVDLVVELPAPYCLATAEKYARGAVFLLKSLGVVDELSFGSECGDIGMLRRGAAVADEFSNSKEVIDMLEEGKTYPAAIYELTKKKYGDAVSSLFEGPNNELAIEYIRAINHLEAKIDPFTIVRLGNEHDAADSIIDGYASASAIRKSIFEGKDFTDKAPEETCKAIFESLKSGKISRGETLERLFLYKLRSMSVEDIAKLPDVAQGLEHRIYEARDCTSMADVLKKVKTKRYTMARIRRIFFNMLLGITAEDLNFYPPYGRILATNERGFEILSEAKGKAVIPFGTSLAKLSAIDEVSARYAKIESDSTDIYSLSCKKVQSAGLDYRTKVSIVD